MIALWAICALIGWFSWQIAKRYLILHEGKPLPGPIGLPLVGYMPFVGREPYKTFTKLSKTYGEIFQVNLGIRTVIVLNSIEVMRNTFGKDAAYAGRPNIPSLKTFLESGGQSRFAFRTGNAQWRFLRKTALKALSLFASSRNSKLQAVVEQAVESMHADFENQKEQPSDPKQSIFACVAGIIGAINFGGDFDRNDPLLRNVVSLTERVSKFIEIGSLLDFFPFGAFFMRSKIKGFLEAIDPVNRMTEKHINQRECCDDSEQVRDVADALWIAAREATADHKQQLNISDGEIRYISQDLFGAGFGTTMETFRWCVNLVAAHPDIQERVRKEIFSVVGDRPPTLEDRNKLHYCEAVLLEVFRFCSLAPLAIPHAVMTETEYNGYRIPEGALVLANLYAHHRKECIFPNAESFHPDRFLLADNTLDKDLAQHVIMFGVGKRRCVGENLARQEIFLLLTQTVQRFEIAPEKGTKIDINTTETGFVRRTLPCKLIFKTVLAP